jgi:hypothetical protein
VILVPQSTICPIANLRRVMTWRLAEKKTRKKGQERSCPFPSPDARCEWLAASAGTSALAN